MHPLEKWVNGLRRFQVANNISREIQKIVYSERFEWVLLKLAKKNRHLFSEIQTQITKILREPTVGKPLRHVLKNRRRLHVGSFVLVYEFHNGELRFIDFDHHDKIYKK